MLELREAERVFPAAVVVGAVVGGAVVAAPRRHPGAPLARRRHLDALEAAVAGRPDAGGLDALGRVAPEHGEEVVARDRAAAAAVARSKHGEGVVPRGREERGRVRRRRRRVGAFRVRGHGVGHGQHVEPPRPDVVVLVARLEEHGHGLGLQQHVVEALGLELDGHGPRDEHGEHDRQQQRDVVRDLVEDHRQRDRQARHAREDGRGAEHGPDLGRTGREHANARRRTPHQGRPGRPRGRSRPGRRRGPRRRTRPRGGRGARP